MTDGFFSRPSLAAVGTAPARAVDAPHRRLPRPARASTDWTPCCRCTPTSTTRWTRRVVAERTGAQLVGGTSAASIGRGGGPARGPARRRDPRRTRSRSAPSTSRWSRPTTARPTGSPASSPRRSSPPVKASAYRCGESWSTLVHHRPSDRRLLVVGSAGFVPGALAGSPRRGRLSRRRPTRRCSPSATSSTTGPRPCGRSAPAASC